MPDDEELYGPYGDDWMTTDDENIDAVCDGENIICLQTLVYKLARERDEFQILGFNQGWEACESASRRGILK